MKYIDADKLIAEIRNLRSESCISESDEYYEYAKSEIIDIITSLPQEQPEDIVIIAKTFLDALSKTPYNNKPITDAQIIVRQLLLFFENPKEYNPDAIFEQPEVNLEELLSGFTGYYAHENSGEYPSAIDIARHFYNIGLNSKK